MCDKCLKPFKDLEKVLTDKRRSTKSKIRAALELAIAHRPGPDAAKFIRKAMNFNDKHK